MSTQKSLTPEGIGRGLAIRVFIVAALSADGYIARRTDEVADWTAKEDKQLFVELTKRAGVMVMGSTTFRTIGRPLPGRKTIVYTHHQLDAAVETTTEAPSALITRLASAGYRELAICGGRSVYDMFLRAGVVDELYLTIEPVVFGAGITLFAAAQTVDLELLDTRLLNDNTVMHHYAVRNQEQ